jgi:hypothetical protein
MRIFEFFIFGINTPPAWWIRSNPAAVYRFRVRDLAELPLSRIK